MNESRLHTSSLQFSFSESAMKKEKGNKKPVYETPDGRFVVIMGVRVKKAEAPIAPAEPINFKFTTTSLEILRDIAVSYNLGLPLIVSGDSGVGKTAALKKFSELIGAKLHLVHVNEDTTIRQLTVKPAAVGSGFDYVDGPITEAMRARPGEVHLVVLDEVNTMRSEQTSGLHGILDAWEGGGTINTWKPLGDGRTEHLAFPKAPKGGQVYFAMTMNPSGKGYHGRKQLDDALARRCHLSQHQRNTTRIMEEMSDMERGDSITVGQELFLYSRETPLPMKELVGMSEYQKLNNAYIRFHDTINKKIEARELGKSQNEGIYFGDIDSRRRVNGFLCQFYGPSENGDLRSVFIKALEYFYVQRFTSEADRLRVKEMIAAFAPEDRASTKSTVTETKAKEYAYTRPPKVDMVNLVGHGTWKDAGQTLTKKNMQSAGQAELNYTWSLMERYNNGHFLSKTELEYLSQFKRQNVRFVFFGTTNTTPSTSHYGHIQRVTQVSFLYYDKDHGFSYGVREVQAKWDRALDGVQHRAVVMK